MKTLTMSDAKNAISLTKDEAQRVANSLEMLYYGTMADAYAETDWQAAKDAMTIRDRAGIEPNPHLLDGD